MLVAKAGKPFTAAEELILPASEAMANAVAGEKAD
jgi:hypothetical protein